MRLQLASEWLLEKSRLTVAIHIFTRNSPRAKREVQMNFGDLWENKYVPEKEGISLCRRLEGEECEWDPRREKFFPVRDPLPWEW